ncbi:MAG: alpha-amlyase [Zunongwangia sp.]|uniref:Alpha-amylase (Neopullulanase) SusA n=4 Tax=Zunongwangia profunda TaxID=398743 RepID=D5BG23_ZUNPS|nr:glycoside hydrolase family 13 protein [Zunongwangia profunda]ADF53136.1 alpha-amylase (neopullulanase) SusA [Zunongwangia profunda SM-A87]MAO36889.1 alpha-amlyase [Zunongwangia sp.]MAS69425.1 alpha-amlyase [Zunongwangia sp.]|tara:strand:+ start:3386 stop:5233 length:1848 start_codon:yes stop_codon:yes gene_type:complete
MKTKLYNLVLLLLLISGVAQAQIDKMEPPFWWSDMNLEELQIMFYGKNIGTYEVSSEDEVIINNIRKTENPNYVFVTINSSALPAGNYEFNFSKKGKRNITKTFELKQREEGSALREGFDASDAIYLIMPDRFANGNPDNDSSTEMQEKADRSKQGGRHGGDIQGVIDHLDYLKNLGITALWSTPLLADDDAGYSYHTYAQSDVYKIDPRYGSNEDYKRLANELHQKDMKLIMDYVTNHWGSEHWMIKDLPTYDWVHQFPGYENSNYRMTTQYDPHKSARDFKYCVDGWFTGTMPDLNQSNPLVLNYLIQNAIWWIEYSGLDGFRVDTYSYNDKEGIAKWTKAIMDEYPYFNIVGEVWMHDQAQISYWQKDSPIGAIQDYNSNLPSVMDFTLHDAMTSMFHEQDASWDRGMIKAYENFVNDFLYADTDNLMVFMGNHDTGRFNEIYDGDFKKYKMAMTMIATVRGTPQIYYGDEIGMRGDKGKGDGAIRQDFPGGWEGDEQSAFNAEDRTENQMKYFDLTSKLLNFRKENEVLQFGKMLQFLPENNVYVYFRYNDKNRVMVIINNNAEEQTLDLKKYAEGIQGSTSGKEIISGKDIQLNETLSIPAQDAMLIQLQ